MAFTELVQKAIEAGDVVATDDMVKISAKASPDGKEHSKTYTKLVALTARGMAALCNGKIVPATEKPEGDAKDERTDEQKANGACDYFNYGFDLEVRAKTRQSLMGDLEGPEKEIRKMVLALVGADYEASQVREMVLNSPKFKGIEGIDNLVNSALKAAA